MSLFPNLYMNTSSKITIEQILKARDMRAEKQRQFICEYGLPLISFTLNIAGEIKNSPLIEFLFMCGVEKIREFPFEIKYEEVHSEETGPVAYFVFNGDAGIIKNKAVELEESEETFRLFDIDVIDKDFKKLSRESTRKCLICDNMAQVCARSRAHGLDTIKEKTQELLISFASKKLAYYAQCALYDEVHTTPKAGLVDENNSGSHTDMDIAAFEKSIAVLGSYFEKIALVSMREHEKEPQTLMKHLREIGIEAENAMLEVTNGVNTHKGLIYSLGLLIADIGGILMGLPTRLSLLASVGMKDAFDKAKNSPETHGEMQYSRCGAKGIRGEAQGGFKTAKEASKILSEYKKTLDKNTAQALTLVEIMKVLEDTNVLHRGGMEALSFMRMSAEKIASADIDKRLSVIKKLDDEFIKRNISPGGCADTLALAIFLDLFTQKHYYL